MYVFVEIKALWIKVMPSSFLEDASGVLLRLLTSVNEWEHYEREAMAASEKLAWVLTWSIVLIELGKWSEINGAKLSVLRYIGSLAEDVVFEELVILSRPGLLCQVLCLRLEQPIRQHGSCCKEICGGAPYQPARHAGGRHEGDNSPAHQEKMHGFACYTKLKALQHGREKEPTHGQDLRGVLGENPPAVCLMLRESGLPSIWRDARLTHYPYSSFYSMLLNQLCYYATFCWAF